MLINGQKAVSIPSQHDYLKCATSNEKLSDINFAILIWKSYTHIGKITFVFKDLYKKFVPISEIYSQLSAYHSDLQYLTNYWSNCKSLAFNSPSHHFGQRLKCF